MKVLIIEDNEKLARSLKRGLEQEGFAADCLFDGESGQKRLEVTDHAYDLVILDIMLPKKDGIAVCKELRAQHISIPILMLTAKDTVPDKINGLNHGADDYLIKPFSFDELVARLRALLRRPEDTLSHEFRAGNLVLNPATHRVEKNGKEIRLSQKEFSILEYMMRNQGKVLRRQEILDHVWDYDFNSFSNLIDVKIKNLRKKVDKDGTIIETIRGIGYRLNP
jgi:DNA-binding response OmpR family regulator